MGVREITTERRNPYRPLSFAKTRQGLLLMVDGLDRGLVWDGIWSTALPIGITGPERAPLITVVSGGGLSNGSYDCYYRFVDQYGNPSNLSPAKTVTAFENTSFQWTFETSPESRVVKRELWRTLAGDSRVVYLVAEINDNVTTTHTEGISDDVLRERALRDPNTAMPLFEEPFGRPVANRYSVPPSHKAVVAIFQDRSFWAVDAVYDVGTVTLTNGSKNVVGNGTDWKAGMKGRYLYIKDPSITFPYLIKTIDSATALTLDATFYGASGTYSYVIRPAPSERNKLYFSVADNPEAVPPTSTYTIQENTGDDDEITGLMPHGSYLYVLKDRHIYRLSYVRQPEIDIACHLHAFRGCFNQRCWARVENIAYLLDQFGPYRLLPSGEVDPIGTSINDFWISGGIDFSQSKWFFVHADTRHEVVRFFVSKSGQTRPAFALCYQYRANAWWMEEYHWEFGAGVTYVRNGEVEMYVGAIQNRWYWQNGQLDGTAGLGTVRGTVSSATATTLVDLSATFPTDIVGCPVAIVSGTGKGQVRNIASRVSDTEFTISEPWATTPDSTSVYQIGAIACSYKGPVFSFLPIDVSSERHFRLWYVPLSASVTLDLERYINHSTVAERLPYRHDDHGDGYSFEQDATTIQLHLGKGRASLGGLGEASGLIALRVPDAVEDRSEVDRWVQYRLSGYSGEEAIRIRAIELYGVEQRER